MIICKTCGKETPVAIKGEFLCYKCYDKRMKERVTVKPPTFRG